MLLTLGSIDTLRDELVVDCVAPPVVVLLVVDDDDDVDPIKGVAKLVLDCNNSVTLLAYVLLLVGSGEKVVVFVVVELDAPDVKVVDVVVVVVVVAVVAVVVGGGITTEDVKLLIFFFGNAVGDLLELGLVLLDADIQRSIVANNTRTNITTSVRLDDDDGDDDMTVSTLSLK